MNKTYFKEKKSVSSIFTSFNGKFLGDNVTVGSLRAIAKTIKCSMYDYSLDLNIRSAEYFVCNIVE